MYPETKTDITSYLKERISFDIPKNFDPLSAQKRISDQASRVSGGFNSRNRERIKLIEQLAEEWELDFNDTFDFISAAERASWGIEEARMAFGDLLSDVKVMDDHTLTRLIAVNRKSKDVLTQLGNSGQFERQSWVAISSLDALFIWLGIKALEKEDKVSLGKKVVDLGGGKGSWGFVLSSLGFQVDLIEKKPILCQMVEAKRRQLEELGVETGDINVVEGEFHSQEEENTEGINELLQEADIMVCYIWPKEINDRLSLFSEHGKPESVLVLFSGGEFPFSINMDAIERFGLEVVGEDENTSEKKPEKVYGIPALSYGWSWLMLRKR